MTLFHRRLLLTFAALAMVVALPQPRAFAAEAGGADVTVDRAASRLIVSVEDVPRGAELVTDAIEVSVDGLPAAARVASGTSSEAGSLPRRTAVLVVDTS